MRVQILRGFASHDPMTNVRGEIVDIDDRLARDMAQSNKCRILDQVPTGLMTVRSAGVLVAGGETEAIEPAAPEAAEPEGKEPPAAG